MFSGTIVKARNSHGFNRLQKWTREFHCQAAKSLGFSKAEDIFITEKLFVIPKNYSCAIEYA